MPTVFVTILFSLCFLLNFSEQRHLPFEVEFDYERLPVKRFNFNFLRTWQPLSHAEPFNSDSTVNSMSYIGKNSIRDTDPSITKQRKIRQKLMCIAALKSTKACQIYLMLKE
uniref:Secreted protein n=1 Tax=Panagrolaimus sp. JU765 TaxID=591449 RepID=A0AC34Q2K9_9BILA